MDDKEYISVPQLAAILGMSRIAVYKRIKNGQIKAKKIGRNFAISKEYVSHILGKKLSDKTKDRIDFAIKKTIRDYGDVLKLLGRE